MQPMVAGTGALLLAAPSKSSLVGPRLGRIGGHCQQFLSAETELFDGENNCLFLDRCYTHAAQGLTDSNSVLLLRRDIPHNRNRVAAVGIERDGDELQI